MHGCSMTGVEMYLHGATITRWLRPDGTPALDSHAERLQDSIQAWAQARDPEKSPTPTTQPWPGTAGTGLVATGAEGFQVRLCGDCDWGSRTLKIISQLSSRPWAPHPPTHVAQVVP